MRDFGLIVEHDRYQTFYIKGNQVYQSPAHYAIEPDVSSASYFMAAAAINGRVLLEGINLHSCQGEIAFARVLEQMGAQVVVNEQGIEVSQGNLRGIDIDANDFTDTAMTLAMVFTAREQQPFEYLQLALRNRSIGRDGLRIAKNWGTGSCWGGFYSD